MAITTHDKAFQDQVLTNMIKAYMMNPSAFVARGVAPSLMVNKDKGQIYGYGSQGIRLLETARAVGGRYKKVDFKVEKTNQWVLQDYGLSADIFREEVENAEDPLQAQQAKAKMIAEIMLINYENAIASKINTTNITNNVTLSGTDQWSDYVGSDPFADIETGKEAVRKASGKKPNSILIARDAFVVLKQHPDILNRFPGRVAITDQDLEQMILKDLFGFTNVYIGEAAFDSVNLESGQLESGNDFQDIWTNMCLIFYSEESPELYSQTLMKTFEKRDGLVVGTYQPTDEEMRTQKKEIGVMVEHERDVAFVNTRCGYLIDTPIA